MRKVVDTLLQLNLKRFRVPQKTMTKYSALDVMKQALELLFEFTPSEKNYREAMRTIQVYSEGDAEMLQVLKSGFKFIANAVYNTYAGQRYAERLSPEILFLQGLPFDQAELQQAFRFVGVKPTNAGTPTVKKMYFLDQGYEPYRRFLLLGIGAIYLRRGERNTGVSMIESALSEFQGRALLRVGSDHVESHLVRFFSRDTGHLVSMLRKRDIEVEVVEKIADLNQVFGKH
jgi:hypothetical protein